MPYPRFGIVDGRVITPTWKPKWSRLSQISNNGKPSQRMCVLQEQQLSFHILQITCSQGDVQNSFYSITPFLRLNDLTFLLRAKKKSPILMRGVPSSHSFQIYSENRWKTVLLVYQVLYPVELQPKFNLSYIFIMKPILAKHFVTFITQIDLVPVYNNIFLCKVATI